MFTIVIIAVGWLVAILYVYCFYAKKLWDAKYHPEEPEDEKKEQ